MTTLFGDATKNVQLPSSQPAPVPLDPIFLYQDPPTTKPATAIPLPPLPSFIDEPTLRLQPAQAPYIPLPSLKPSPGVSPVQQAERKQAAGIPSTPADILGSPAAQDWLPWILAALALAGVLMLVSGERGGDKGAVAQGAPGAGGGRKAKKGKKGDR